MKKYVFLFLLVAVQINAAKLHAQDSTIPFKPGSIAAEEMIGHKRQFFQILVNKMITERKKTGFMSISSYAAGYHNNPGNNEFQNTTFIYHHVFKGISISSGTGFTSFEGLKNFVGLLYLYQDKTLSLLYMPGYYFINSHKISNLALVEYKPAITKTWLAYTRLQLHYNHDLKNGHHFRSYVYSRLGFTYRFFSFGLAHNYDRYGAKKNIKNNYGLFLKLTL